MRRQARDVVRLNGFGHDISTTAINTKEVDIAAHLGLKDCVRLVSLWYVEYYEEKEGEEEGKTETLSSSST